MRIQESIRLPSQDCSEKERKRKVEEQLILELSGKNNIVELYISIWTVSMNKVGGSVQTPRVV